MQEYQAHLVIGGESTPCESVSTARIVGALSHQVVILESKAFEDNDLLD